MPTVIIEERRGLRHLVVPDDPCSPRPMHRTTGHGHVTIQ